MEYFGSDRASDQRCRDEEWTRIAKRNEIEQRRMAKDDKG
jgi:hypothetical protein